jgi:hypothetical protein
LRAGCNDAHTHSGNMYTLLHRAIGILRAAITDRGKGDNPVATSGRPSVQRIKSSAFASDCVEGFESGKMTGRSAQPCAEEVLGHGGIDVSNPRGGGGIQHLMATPLQFGDASLEAEVTLPSKRNVRGSAKRSKTETQAADNELGLNRGGP